MAKVRLRLPHLAWKALRQNVIRDERQAFYDPDTKQRNFVLGSDEGETIVVIDQDSSTDKLREDLLNGKLYDIDEAFADTKYPDPPIKNDIQNIACQRCAGSGFIGSYRINGPGRGGLGNVQYDDCPRCKGTGREP